jgi:DmsE family decaheme c-type cytochrome
LPTVPGAEYVREDSLCKVCHSEHAQAFENNVHRQHNCESCHGPASRHLETRGREPGTILAFDRLSPIERSEICAKCHQSDACSPSDLWRTSAHAAGGVSCTDCHTAHYDVPPGTPTVVGSLAQLPDDWRVFLTKHRAQISQPGEQQTALPSLRGTSNNLGAIAPQACYKCHPQTQELQQIAHPHQILGEHGFNCTTCHNPHGNVIEHSRKDLCLQCHDVSSPTLAWHSSSHNLAGVACTDCHNPHPSSSVEPVVNVSHTHVQRHERLPMSVNDPQACYKCHPKVFAQSQMPSHHPIREGKLVCSDCHDPHGQAERNLKGDSLNSLCYRCHAEKQGPFVYEHPPVTQDCSICHEPHGTVANNLLHQPTTFLCLRCHTGHRTVPGDHPAFSVAEIDGDPARQAAFFTDCTQCHDQIHGTDHRSQRSSHALLR